MIRVSIRAFLLLILGVAALDAQPQNPVFDAFSSTEWRPEGPAATYADTEISKFDPSMAETLKKYGIRDISVQDWLGPKGRVHAAVYRMTDSAAAYGVYSITRNIHAPGYAELPLGAEGFRLGRKVMFWKGVFLVDLDGDPPATDEWARYAASQIGGDSQRPPVSSYLPREGRIRGTDRYLLHASSVAGDWGFDPVRLGFEKSAEAATAQYLIGGKTLQLLLVLYPTQHLAKQFEEGLRDASPTAVRFRKRDGPLFAIVDSRADQAAAEALLGDIRHEFQVTWNEPPPGPGIAEIVLTIFKVIGVALTVTLLSGIAFGVIRVLTKRWFPGRVFDRPEDMEIIQLKLNERVIGEDARADHSPSIRSSQ